nr:armadillo repeat-containing protein 12 isoform X2 [Camelus dromedarius]
MDLENQGPALSPGRFLPGKPSGLLCVLRVGWKGGTPGRAGAAEHGRGGVKQGVGAGRGGSGGRERRESESGGGGGAGGPERKNILCPPPDARGGAGEGGEVVGGGRTRWGEARGGERRGLRPRPGPRPYEVPLPPLPGLLPPFFQSPRLRRRKELPRGPRIRSWPGASACTNDDIALVGSMLDDKDNSVKIQALNTLKAFSGIRKFRLKIQEHSIKVLELISTIWDSELHIAGLRLLNNMPLPDFVHPQLRRVMPALMEILQSDYILAQVQAIRLLSNLAQKNDLLYDILNCQVQSNFLNLFQSTQPGSLLFEVLVFAERLSEGRSSPHYRAVKWHYNEQSVHEALFGDDSRLADRLLALVIHPEEDVQIQACKVIVSLQCPPEVGVLPSCPPSHSCFNNGE